MWTDKGNILVAQEIGLPGESFEVAPFSIGNSSGAYMPSFAANKRSDFLSRNVTINFLETNVDIESQLFRPWAIALSVDGLINKDLKTTIDVCQYDNKRRVRKRYKFYGVFPTNCETSVVNYTDDTIKSKTVTFAYSKYEILTETSEDAAIETPGALDLGGRIGNIA
jgi:hypothetical protein